MDCNHLEILAERYLAAKTSIDEEQAFARELGRIPPERLAALSPELTAAAAMLRDAERRRGDTVRINMRTAASPLRMAAATALSAAAIVTAALFMSRPTVYGYVNGAPVTSMAEARRYSEQMFSDLAEDMQPAADAIDVLRLTLD